MTYSNLSLVFWAETRSLLELLKWLHQWKCWKIYPSRLWHNSWSSYPSLGVFKNFYVKDVSSQHCHVYLKLCTRGCKNELFSSSVQALCTRKMIVEKMFRMFKSLLKIRVASVICEIQYNALTEHHAEFDHMLFIK